MMNTRNRVMGLAFSLTVVTTADAQTGSEARAAARRHREANEAKILREFSTLLALPNVASNRDDIRRNADLLINMLRQRGATAQILEVPDAPVSVFGEIRAPGATRTIVLYAHFDGQPVDPRQWQGEPFTPLLRDKALYQG
ncbi:MAG: hypothetical protein ACRD2A_11670, partial [Vicinamibacterales bacterium]